MAVWGEVRWNEERFHTPPHKIVDMQCRKEGENSGSKKRKRGHRVVVERQQWARHPHGLDLSHCVAMWFGASHTPCPAPLSPPRGR